MARSGLSDFLQSYAFWLTDISNVNQLSAPIFTPVLGFSTISSPEMSVEMQEITEGNWHFRRKVVKKASVSTISMQRGALFVDSDFYKWIVFAVTGEPIGPLASFPGISGQQIAGLTPRRNLLLIQFFSRIQAPPLATAALIASTTILAGGGAGGLAAAAGIGIAGSGLGPFEFASRLPARAWLLQDCIPTRYKTGSDFDATSGAVSMMDLDVECEQFTEVSVAG